MQLLWPWGLWTLFALPLIIALHLWRRRLPPLRVNVLFLWGGQAQPPSTGRRWQWLRSRASLWWELLAAAALAFLLAQPSVDGGGRLRLVVLDGHQRLAARDSADGTSARDRVLARLATISRSWSSADRCALISSGQNPHLIASDLSAKELPEAAQRLWQVDQVGHDMSRTLSLALELSNNQGEIWWCSDRLRPELGKQVQQIACGRVLAHSGIVAIERHTQEIALALAAQGAAVTRTLEIIGAGQEPRVVQVNLDETPRWLRIPDQGEALTLRLLGEDALPQDDVVSLPEQDRRKLKLFLDPPWQDDPALSRLWADLSLQRTNQAQEAHLICGSSSGNAETWSLGFTTPDQQQWLRGPFLSLEPLAGEDSLSFLDSSGLLVRGGLSTIPASWQGRYFADGLCVALWRQEGRAWHLRLAVDPQSGNFLRHPWWPALLSAWAQARRAALPDHGQRLAVLGSSVRWVLPSGMTSAQVQSPSGTMQILHADRQGQLWLNDLHKPGSYHISDSDGAVLGNLQVPACDWPGLDLQSAQTAEQITDIPVDEHSGDAARALRLALILLVLASSLCAWRAWRRESGA